MAGLVVGGEEGGGSVKGEGNGKGGFGKGERKRKGDGKVERGEGGKGGKGGIFDFDFGEEVRRCVAEAGRVAGGAGRGVVFEGSGKAGVGGEAMWKGKGGGRKRKR